MLQHARGVPNVAPAADAEAPELLRRALVAVHEIVELEDVDLARVEPLEPRPQTRDQRRKLLLVVSRYAVSCSNPGGLFFRTPPRHSAAPLQRPTTKDDVTADVAFRRKQHYPNRIEDDRLVQAEGLDPQGHPELLDVLAAWVERERPHLEQQRWVVAAKDERLHGKWCGTVEIEAGQRVGYLSVWSSGELDCQVLRGAEFYVLNEHRLVRSAGELEQALTTFLEVVGYADPREPMLL